MDVICLAAAAALLVVGAAAAVVQRWRPAVAALVLGLCLPPVVLASALDPAAATLSVATAALPVLVPIAAWGCTKPRPSVVLALVAGLVAGPLRGLVYDPYYDLSCLTRCPHNPYAVHPLGPGVSSALLTVGLAAPVAVTWAAVTGRDRLTLGLLALAAWLAVAPGDREVLAVTLAGLVLLVRVGVDVARGFDDRARVAELADALRSADDLDATLGRAAGDPRLVVTYWLDDEKTFVLSDGSLTTGTRAGLSATDIRGPDGLVARFLHAPGTDTRALADAVAGSARIALENGRLRARVQRQARRLQASRLRIVTDADAERRRLERDLHDGAQQHLLALGLELRRVADSAHDPDEQAVLDASLATTQQVLDGLREISHGFYPSTLDQVGLGSALESVADRSPVPISIRAVPETRLPVDVERAIYLLVFRLASVADGPLEVRISRGAADAEVRVRGAGVPDGVLLDTFAVLGGSVVSHSDGSVPVVRATLPLASGLAVLP
jgi:signal transduction histidine kinase